MRSLFAKLILILLLLLFGSAGAIFFYRVELIERAVPYLLTKKNFSDITLDLESFSLTTLEISSFSAHYANSSFKGKIDCKDGVLQYRLLKLTNFTLEQLDINELNVYVEDIGKKHNQEKKAPNLEEIREKIDSLQEFNLPIQKVRINRLLVTSSSIPILEEKPLSIFFHSQAESTVAEAALTFDDDNIIKTRLTRNEQKSFTADLLHLQHGKNIQAVSAVYANGKLAGEIKLDSLNINHLLSDTLPEDYGAKIGAQFTLKLATQPTIHLHGTAQEIILPQAKADQVNFNLTATQNSLDTFLLSDDSSLIINGLLSKDIKVQKLTAPLPCTMTKEPQRLVVRFNSPLPWTFEKIASDQAGVNKLTLVPPEKLTVEQNLIKLNLNDRFLVEATQLDTADIQIPKLQLELQNKSPQKIEVQDQRRIILPGLSTGELVLKKDGLKISSSPVSIMPFTFFTGENNLESDLSFSAQHVSVQQQNNTIPVRSISGKLSLKKEKLSVAAKLNPRIIQGKITLNAEHDLASGEGSAQIKTEEHLFFDDKNGPDKLIHGLAIPFELVRGEIDFSSVVRWQPSSLKGEAAITIREGTGKVNDVLIEGLFLDHSIQFLPAIQSTQPGKIEIKTIHSVAPVTNLAASFEILQSEKGNLPAVFVDQLTTELLDGNILLKDITYDPNLDTNRIVVQANEINLATIIDIFKVKGLQVGGKINGSIPIEIAPKGVMVTDGLLTGIHPGGYIEYKPEGLNSGQSQFTEYVLKALEEFHFTILEAPVTYYPDGTLLVSLKLQGISPSLSKTRPVHLNINTEQNLLSLVKSLKYNNSVLTEELQKRLQNQR